MARSNLMVHFLLLLIAVCIVSGNDQAPKCYGELGCFPTYDPWTSIYRPAFPAPQSPEECGTFLIYFNREKGRSIEDGFKVTLHPEISMEESGYDPKRSKTYFIAHGFINSGNQSWMSEMKDALLYKEDANVFIVDWGKGAEIINYFQAASNTRVVGAELGRFLRYLMKTYNLNPRNVHLIGHSLGAQIASYAAKIVHGIGRVTGLDPAQPGFEGTPVIVRIDKSDAEFVDAFHTNCRPTIPTLGFGMIETVGDVDIYFNGGLDQPGCFTPDGVPYANLIDLATVPVKVLGKWISCSHLKAFQYFTASINSKCKIWARKTGKLRSMINAVSFGELEPITAAIVKCSRSTCTAAGLDTPKYAARGMFAATTLKIAPYCDADIDPDYDKKILAQINDGEEEKEEEHKYSIPADISIEKLASTVESIQKDVNDAIESIDRIIADRVGSTKKSVTGGVETAENGITSGVETAENGITSGVETAKKGITSGVVKETMEKAGSVISKIPLPKLSGGAESTKTEQGGPSEIKE